LKQLKLFILLIISIYIFGCSKDDDPTTPVITAERGVYVVNEGNYGRNNASLSFYSIDSNKISNDIFYSVNGKKLGDVGQNVYIKDSKVYIVVNNSNKIAVINASTQKLIDTITTNLTSPRAIAFYGNYMYVSNLYGSNISVFTGENYKTFVKNITVKNYPDEMITVNNKIYCCHTSFSNKSTTLSVIDPQNSDNVKTIRIGYNPNMIKSLSDGSIAILCTGEYNDYANLNDDFYAYLYLLNSNTDAVTDSISIGGHPMDFVIDASDNAYITGDAGIIKVDLKNKKITNSSLISGYFYAIGYDKERNEIYLSDPKDFTASGDVLIYSLSGTLRTKFTAGIIPGAFCFK
jgi:YVTN family beta-propeller protein